MDPATRKLAASIRFRVLFRASWTSEGEVTPPKRVSVGYFRQDVGSGDSLARIVTAARIAA